MSADGAKAEPLPEGYDMYTVASDFQIATPHSHYCPECIAAGIAAAEFYANGEVSA